MNARGDHRRRRRRPGGRGAPPRAGGPAARHGERLGHVVVGAGVEGVDLVLAVLAGGQHHDRHAGPAADGGMTSMPSMSGRPRSSSTTSGCARAAEIAAAPVAGGRDLPAAGAQRDRQRVRERRLVVDHEDARPSGCRPPAEGRVTQHRQATAGGVLGVELAADGLAKPRGDGEPEPDARARWSSPSRWNGANMCSLRRPGRPGRRRRPARTTSSPTPLGRARRPSSGGRCRTAFSTRLATTRSSSPGRCAPAAGRPGRRARPRRAG